jgi:hypothetical protein
MDWPTALYCYTCGTVAGYSIRGFVMGLKEKLAEKAARNRQKVEPAELPADWECAGEIFIRKLSAKERDNYEVSRRKIRVIHKPGGKVEQESIPQMENLRARLLVKCLSDQHGQRIYGDDDAELVGDLFDGEVADALFEQAAVFNKLDQKELAEKNDSPTGSGSGSDSPSPSGNGTSTPSSN